MASILAIISKAVFEPIARAAGGAKPGTVLSLDRYTSTHPSLDALAEGGALFLVTARPGDVLWLVGIIEDPRRESDGWHGRPNTTPIVDLGAVAGELRFSTGKGITAKPGALGMSLQTPRVLTSDDVGILREAAGAPGSLARAVKVARAVKTAKAAKAVRSREAAKAVRAKLGAAKNTNAKARAKTKAKAQKARAKLAAEPATPKPQKKRNDRTAMPAIDGSALAPLADTIAAGDVAAALAAALAAWRATRAPALADLVDAIGARIEIPTIPDDVEWTKLARTHDPVLLGALLAKVTDLPVSFLPAVGDALAAFPDDPRIAIAVATWALDPPTTSSSTYPFWTRTIEAMTRAGDARTLPLLERRLGMKPGGSKFWPKFYAAIEKAIARISETSAAKVDTKKVARLVKAADKLALEAHVPAAPARATATPSAPKLGGPPLRQAAKHLEAGRVQAAIDAMLVAWRALDRVVEIADLIDRATRLLPTWDRPLAVFDADADAAWNAAFATDPMAAMPQLLEFLGAGGPRVAEQHLVQLATLPEDPRVALRLTELSSRFDVSPERTQYWKSLFEILGRIRDPRVAPSLRKVFDDFTGTYYNHHRQARRIIGAWAKNPPVPPLLGPEETADLAAISRALDALESKRDRTEQQLVDAIVDAWNDAGPRLVYADWLIDRQHPRGEVIVLDCKPKRSAAETKRLNELLRKASHLYGPLDAFGNRPLDRGLPTRLGASYQTNPRSWRTLVGYPLLAAIDTIRLDSGRRDPGFEPAEIARVLRDPGARRLARIEKITKDQERALAPHLDGTWQRKGTNLVRKGA